jgi:hypothetical protein
VLCSCRVIAASRFGASRSSSLCTSRSAFTLTATISNTMYKATRNADGPCRTGSAGLPAARYSPRPPARGWPAQATPAFQAPLAHGTWDASGQSVKASSIEKMRCGSWICSLGRRLPRFVLMSPNPRSPTKGNGDSNLLVDVVGK